jgi:hypothetical protein
VTIAKSWALPMAIILIVPMCLLATIGGVYLRQMDNNSDVVYQMTEIQLALRQLEGKEQRASFIRSCVLEPYEESFRDVSAPAFIGAA